MCINEKAEKFYHSPLPVPVPVPVPVSVPVWHVVAIQGSCTGF